MIEQEKFSGVRRTLKDDYEKNKAFNVPSTWANPNMEIFNS